MGRLPRGLPYVPGTACSGPSVVLMVNCNASPITHHSHNPRRAPIHMDDVKDGWEYGPVIVRNNLTLSLRYVQVPCLGVCKSPLTRVGQSEAVC